MKQAPNDRTMTCAADEKQICGDTLLPEATKKFEWSDMQSPLGKDSPLAVGSRGHRDKFEYLLIDGWRSTPPRPIQFGPKTPFHRSASHPPIIPPGCLSTCNPIALRTHRFRTNWQQRNKDMKLKKAAFRSNPFVCSLPLNNA